MSAYLQDNPTTVRQYHAPRREQPIGVIGVHTAENALDEIAPDTGAENVARFFARDTRQASYHDIVDSDSTVHLVDYENEAFHIATHKFNRRTTGMSFACRTVDWRGMSPERRAAFIENGARVAYAQAKYHATFTGFMVPARRITIVQALAGQPGFLAHADADPARRSDPGADFPWGDFLAAYSRLVFPPAATPTRISSADMEAIVNTLPILRRGDRGEPVDRMQRLMQSARHVITADGSFGPDTERQLKAFQAARGLTPTGTTDSATWRWLLLGAA